MPQYIIKQVNAILASLSKICECHLHVSPKTLQLIQLECLLMPQNSISHRAMMNTSHTLKQNSNCYQKLEPGALQAALCQQSKCLNGYQNLIPCLKIGTTCVVVSLQHTLLNPCRVPRGRLHHRDDLMLLVIELRLCLASASAATCTQGPLLSCQQ